MATKVANKSVKSASKKVVVNKNGKAAVKKTAKTIVTPLVQSIRQLRIHIKRNPGWRPTGLTPERWFTALEKMEKDGEVKYVPAKGYAGKFLGEVVLTGKVVANKAAK